MKITFIGAGSVVFTRNLVKDILAFPALRNETTICLEDIDPHRIELIKQFIQNIKEHNADELQNVKFEFTLDQKEAIKDAKYVVCSFMVGGMKAYGNDVKIPHRYGVTQVVGDTLGPGGIFRFLRSVPIYESILKDMEELGNKDAVLLNYTNPMAMNTYYCNKISPVSTIGLCHGVQHTSNQLRRWLGVEKDNFSYECFGINHMAWFTKLQIKNNTDSEFVNAYPTLLQKLADNKRLGAKENIRIDMMKATGYYMTESSGHLSEYLPYYLKRWNLRVKYGKIISRNFHSLKQGIDYRNHRLMTKFINQIFKFILRKPIIIPEQPSDEYCSSIINAMETNEPFRFNGNYMQTDGTNITNLLKECCVETPIIADSMGFHPESGFELPPVCQALNLSNVVVQNTAVMGALQRDKELIYHAALLDPNAASSCSPAEIRKMVDKLFEANKEYLTYFE
ncbi:MAG: family 4 glycosyl hydrolase [Promethearchaeota archaeon]